MDDQCLIKDLRRGNRDFRSLIPDLISGNIAAVDLDCDCRKEERTTYQAVRLA